MPGVFRLASNNFEMIDSNGVQVFSTADKLLRVTDVISGSYQFPFHATTPVNSDSGGIVVGTCNASSTMLLGYAQATGGSANFTEIPSSGWFDVSGSYVHSMHFRGDFSYMCGLIIVYSFYISSGTVYVNERVACEAFLTPAGQSASYVPPLLTYELWCATLT